VIVNDALIFHGLTMSCCQGTHHGSCRTPCILAT